MKLNKQINPEVPNIHGSPKGNKYAVISVRGIQSLELQLNAYADAGYSFVDGSVETPVGDMDCVLYAENGSIREVNINGTPVSTKYKVLDIRGIANITTQLNQHNDVGYKLLKVLPIAGSKILILAR